MLPQQEASGLGELAQSLVLPAVLFAGLFFLSRRGAGGPGGMGGPGGPMGFGKAKSEYVIVYKCSMAILRSCSFVDNEGMDSTFHAFHLLLFGFINC